MGSGEINNNTIADLTGYINAGGRGTRLSSIFNPHSRRGVSKALLPIGNPAISLVEHQINKLDKAGVSTIVAGVGDHENVTSYVTEKYADREHVHAIHFANQLGNGGDLVRAVRERSELFKDNVLVVCVDVLVDLDEKSFFTAHQNNGGDLTIALTRNKGVPNEDAYYVDSNDKVVYCREVDQNSWEEDAAKRKAVYRASSTGALIVRKEVLENLPWQTDDGPLPLYSHVIGAALAKQSLFAFDNGERLFTDVGTVASWTDIQSRQDEIAPYIYHKE